MLNKQNKDVDILVENTTLENVKSLLTKYGKIDIVGESFSVIKFRSNQTNIEGDCVTDPQFEFIRNYCKLNKEIYLTFPKRSVKFKW